MKKRAFTLIELLIVVAIIAILAAIAVPNFLEAQVRAKVARCQADMRSLATALETYHIDWNLYPPAFGGDWLGDSVFNPSVGFGVSSRYIPLTTPTAYITSVFPEAFAVNGISGTGSPFGPTAEYDTFDYLTAKDFLPGGYLGGHSFFQDCGSAITSGGAWRLSGVGPDRIQGFGGRFAGDGPTSPFNEMGHDYDTTNGSISSGDIVRVGGVEGNKSTHIEFINRNSGQING